VYHLGCDITFEKLCTLISATAKSKVAPEILPIIKPTTWLDKARDARELPIVNSSTAVFVAVVSTVLVKDLTKE
jgi:hypothetical protein